jgi:predicted type IV restriction endonuclease
MAHVRGAGVDAGARTGGVTMNHQAVILDHLQQGKTIRKQGFEIVTHNEPNLNNKGTHARYELKEVAA